MVKLNRFHVFAALTCVYAAFIFYLSSLSSLPSLSELEFLFEMAHFLEDLGLKTLIYPFYLVYLYPDKFAHVLLYLAFGLFLNWTLSSTKTGALSKYAIPFSILIGTFYAVTDELHQAFVPYRTASSMDLFADFIGLLVAQLLLLIYLGIKKSLSGGKHS
jgi:hypothetical protein